MGVKIVVFTRSGEWDVVNDDKPVQVWEITQEALNKLLDSRGDMRPSDLFSSDIIDIREVK